MPQFDAGNPSQEDYEDDHRTLLGEIARLRAQLSLLQSQRTTAAGVVAPVIASGSGSGATGSGGGGISSVSLAVPTGFTASNVSPSALSIATGVDGIVKSTSSTNTLSAAIPGTDYTLGAELAPCLAVATANVASLSGTTTVDGVALVAGNHVLLTAQTTGSQNGPWVVAAGAWTRPADYATGASVGPSAFVLVAGGTLGASTIWQLTGATSAITVDTTSTTWSRFAPIATTSVFGLVKPDGSTVTISGGVLSAPGGGGGGTTTLYNAIDGFQLAYSTTTAITLTAGAAYVDSATAMVAKTTGQTVTIAGGSPTASTWYYIYLPSAGTAYASTTTPAVNSAGRWEASVTAAGATQHDRLLGAVYSNASSQLINFRHSRASDEYRWDADVYNSPMNIINGTTTSGVTTASAFGPSHMEGIFLWQNTAGAAQEAVSWGNSVVTPSNSTLQPHGTGGYVHPGGTGANTWYSDYLPLPDHTTVKINKGSTNATSVFCVGWVGPGA